MSRMRAGLNPMDGAHIIANLREWDRKEIFATRGDDEHEKLLADTLMVGHLPGMLQTWYADDGEPVSINGFYQQWPGVANVFAFGTDRWPEVVLAMTKHVRRVIVPTLVREGYHRAECAALHEREDTKRWLPVLGLRLEAVLAGFGRQREDFGLYVWKPSHVHESQRQGRPSPDDAGSPSGGGSPRPRGGASDPAEVRF